jgi:hypothetical protein
MPEVEEIGSGDSEYRKKEIKVKSSKNINSLGKPKR